MQINDFVNTPIGVFADATVDTIIIVYSNNNNINGEIKISEAQGNIINELYYINQSRFLTNDNYLIDILTNDQSKEVLNKIEENCLFVDDLFDVSTGIKEYQVGKGIPKQTQQDKILEDSILIPK
jgi:hypothetical protein